MRLFHGFLSHVGACVTIMALRLFLKQSWNRSPRREKLGNRELKLEPSLFAPLMKFHVPSGDVLCAPRPSFVVRFSQVRRATREDSLAMNHPNFHQVPLVVVDAYDWLPNANDEPYH